MVFTYVILLNNVISESKCVHVRDIQTLSGNLG